MKNEVTIMKELSHKHIINLVKDITLGIYRKPNGSEKEVVYIVIEYAAGNELFEYVFNFASFKSFFRLLIQADLRNILLAHFSSRSFLRLNIFINKASLTEISNQKISYLMTNFVLNLLILDFQLYLPVRMVQGN